MICDRSAPEDKAILPSNVSFVECDVGKKNSFKNSFEATEQKFGKVDILVNNAGIVKEHQYEGRLGFIL